MQQHPEHIEQLGSFYQAKRDLFIEGLKGSRFQYEVPQGTYFQNLDYSQICPELNDMEMCKFWLNSMVLWLFLFLPFMKNRPLNYV